jgi:ADP-ribose pyrophosphatase
MTYPDVSRKSTIPEHAKCVFTGVIFDVFQWEQELYDGTKTTFEKLARPDTVTVYGILPDGKILLTEQEQPGKPAFVGPTGGRVDPGEDARTAAQRELREESGYEADEWILWATTEPISKMEWTIHTYVAKGLRKVSDQALDGGEKIALMPVTFDEFLDIATQDNFRETDVKLKVLEAKLDSEKMHALKTLFSL